MPTVRRRTDAVAEAELAHLLETLQRGDFSPLELRILLSLRERDFAQPELTDTLNTPGSIGPAVRDLARRGLVRCWFERGRHPQFVMSITPGGLRALAPIVERKAEADARAA